MDRYSLYLRREVLDAIGAYRRPDRDRILRFLDSLEADPFQIGDFEIRDADLRPYQVRIVGSLAVVYWADHAVREVKVVALRNADR